MAKNKEKCEIRTVAVLSRLGYQAKRNPLICEFLIYNIQQTRAIQGGMCM